MRCNAAGCKAPILSRRLCRRHYAQWWRWSNRADQLAKRRGRYARSKNTAAGLKRLAESRARTSLNYWRDPEKSRRSEREYRRTSRHALADWYVAKNVFRDGIPAHVPASLIEAKRAQLTLSRAAQPRSRK